MSVPVYIENLSLLSLGQILFRLSNLSKKYNQKVALFYIDGSFLAVFFLKRYCHFRGWSFALLSFKLLDVREEESGDIIDLCIGTDYLWKIKESIHQNNFRFLSIKDDRGLRYFLEKSVVLGGIWTPRSLGRSIYIIHILRKEMRLQGMKEGILILMKQPWRQIIQEYADTFGIKLIYIQHFYPVTWPAGLYSFSWISWLKRWADQLLKIYFPQGIYYLRAGFFFYKKKPLIEIENSPKIAIFPVGDWHFENDGFNSDTFFALQSALPNQSLVFLLSKISSQLHSKLTKYNISSCLMNTVPPQGIPIPFYLGTVNISRSHSLDLSELNSIEKNQLRYLNGEYNFQKSYWKELFHQRDIKVYTTWYKNAADHIPIGDALKEIGGIMTIWQRSYEEIPTVDLSIYSDVAFGFSPKLAQIEKAQGSKVNYYVSTGCLKDYNRKLIKPFSLQIRKKLKNKGAKKIVSVFDENSLDDSRWHGGHELQRTHYQFWAEKVLEESWLGVIFKPKTPKTLRHRLGDVNFIVQEAENTGRLLIMEQSSNIASAVPPVLAGLASDISIQGHFFAGTTALECALAGVPSLAVDYEGWRRSWRYELGENVVFPNYEKLWYVLREHWNSSGSVPGLGDWSAFLDDLDPYRDGRAAERMGNYLHWLIQGFEDGLDREVIMGDAAERYVKQWGADKIIEIV